MAQSTAGTALATTWYAASARPCWRVWVKWDGSNWTEETTRCSSARVSGELYDPLAGMPALGRVPPPTAEVILENVDGRFSPSKAAGPLYAYIQNGLERKEIYLEAGYYSGATPEYLTQFTGEIAKANVTMDASGRAVRLTCDDRTASIRQYKVSTTVRNTTHSADAVINAILPDALKTPTPVLDHGRCYLPQWWADAENVWDELMAVAAADFGWVRIDETGTVRFESGTHWLEAAEHTVSQATYNTSRTWWYSDTIGWPDRYTGVLVPYTSRHVERDVVLYESTEAIEIPPNSTKQIEIRFNQPVYSPITAIFILTVSGLPSEDVQAVTAGGEDAGDWLSATGFFDAQRGTLSLTNSNAREAIYVVNLRIKHDALINDETREYRLDASAGDLATYWGGASADTKRFTFPDNNFLCTEEQATVLAGFMRDRLAVPHRILGFKGPLCPFIQLGDRVTVVNTWEGISVEGYLVKKAISYSAGQMSEMEGAIIPATELFGLSGGTFFILGSSAWADSGSDPVCY